MGPRIKMKKCITCGVEKKLDEFYFIKNRNSYKGKCKDCEREYQKVYHKINRKKYVNKEYLSQYIKTYNKLESTRKIMKESYSKYYRTPKGQLNSLKKRLKLAKKESTKNNILVKIEEIKNQINNEKEMSEL